MSNELLPPGEDLARAIRWVDGARRERPGVTVAVLVDEASQRFDLSPKDSAYLLRFFLAQRQNPPPAA